MSCVSFFLLGSHTTNTDPLKGRTAEAIIMQQIFRALVYLHEVGNERTVGSGQPWKNRCLWHPENMHILKPKSHAWYPKQLFFNGCLVKQQFLM